MSVRVNVDNFVRAETDRMFTAFVARDAINVVGHHREPASIADQPVIRPNRDTLYSAALVDIVRGANVVVAGCLGSVSVGDGREQRPLHQRSDLLSWGSRVDGRSLRHRVRARSARILVDPNDSADLEVVHALQNQIHVEALVRAAFVGPEYDSESFTTTREALLTLARVSRRSTTRSAARKTSTR